MEQYLHSAMRIHCMHMNNFEVLLSMTTKTTVLSDVTACKLVATDIPNQGRDIKPNLDKLFVQHLNMILALLLGPFKVDFT
jgi:hypothetical protein